MYRQEVRDIAEQVKLPLPAPAETTGMELPACLQHLFPAPAAKLNVTAVPMTQLAGVRYRRVQVLSLLLLQLPAPANNIGIHHRKADRDIAEQV